MRGKQEAEPAPVPVNRAVYRLARAAGIDADAARGLGAIASSVHELAAAAPNDIRDATGIGQARARTLRDLARLTSALGIAPATASALSERGIGLPELMETDVEELARKLAGVEDATEGALARWQVLAAAAAVRNEARPALMEIPEPRPPVVTPAAEIRRVVVDREDTWEGLARRMYGVAGTPAKEMARRLRLANGGASTTVEAGTVVALPAHEGREPSADPEGAGAAALRAFAPYLSQDDATLLATRGVTSARMVLALSEAADSTQFGVAPEVLRQLETQVMLATTKGVSPEVAHYLAYTRPRTLKDLATANPLELDQEIERAEALGLVHLNGYVSAASWLGPFLGRFHVVLDLSSISDTAVCEATLPPTTFLENYYSYRIAPANRSAESLRQELDAKLLWLAEADDYLTSAGSANGPRTETFANRALMIARVSAEDVNAWGGSNLNPQSLDMLTRVRDFMRDSARILQLLQALAEGHEAYHHREYGLALAAYGRAQGWFRAAGPPKTPPAAVERWWRNQDTGGGVYKPSFLALVEQMPSDLEVQATFKVVHDYYVARAAATDTTTLLDTLQFDPREYHRARLAPQIIGVGPVPFRKHLYYIFNFLLPMARADCLARLGNYCEALDEYFRVHRDASYTAKLPPNDETTIATEVSPPGAVIEMPVLSGFAVAASDGDRFYAPYLHQVERRLVQLRVAETILDWGDAEYRRGLVPSARARYAQVLRILFAQWNGLRTIPFANPATYQQQVAALNINPRAAAIALSAHQQLVKLSRGLNFLGYTADYIPVWTYPFLLSSARYLAERARQLGRDALQFLGSAEQEQGNRRMLSQAAATSQAQLGVETRRVDEAVAGAAVAAAGIDLADQRVANNASRKEELENFGPIRQTLGIVGGAMGGASQGAGLGGMAGPVGGAVGAVLGAGVGGITAYMSGVIEMQSQRNELARERQELEKAGLMAAAEFTRAAVGISVASLSRNMAVMQTAFTQSNLEFAQAKTLSAEFWYETASHMGDLANEYRERAIGVAFLAEQAFEFMEGRRLDVVRFDYSQSDGVLAADALLSDLDAIEYERIVGRQRKSMPLKHVLRLREQDLAAFTEFRRTGTITFETSLARLDATHPGTFQQRFAGIEVEVRAAVPPGGLRGTLRKSGISYLRYDPGTTGAPAVNTQPDWLQYTRSRYRLAPVIQSDETLLLSGFDSRADAVVLRPDPGEQLRVFEGSGAGTTWTLSLRPSANLFVDYGSMADVNIVLYYFVQFDEALDRAMRLERRKLFALGTVPQVLTRGFSLSEMFPDAMYYLHNPSTGGAPDVWRERSLTLPVAAELFPANQVNRRLKSVMLTFLGDSDYIDVHASLASPAVAFPVAAFQNDPSLDPRVRAATANDEPPAATWTLTIKAADNVGTLTLAGTYAVDLAGRVTLDAQGLPVASPAGVPVFDPAQLAAIADGLLVFTYQYDTAGEDGDPIGLWADFGAGGAGAANVSGVVGNAVATTAAWTTTALAGAPAWGLVGGRWTQTVAGAEALTVPNIARDFGALHASVGLRIPRTLGLGAGVVFRKTGAGATAKHYQATLVRAVAGEVKVTLSRVDAGVVTDLQTVASAALGTVTDFDVDVRAVGSDFRVAVNGRAMVSATDNTIALGRTGLYIKGAGVGAASMVCSDLTGRA